MPEYIMILFANLFTKEVEYDSFNNYIKFRKFAATFESEIRYQLPQHPNISIMEFMNIRSCLQNLFIGYLTNLMKTEIKFKNSMKNFLKHI